ncbi:MAG: methylmalonyl-CoA mutase family protein [Calditrichia bacterium]
METNEFAKPPLAEAPDLERFFDEATPDMWRTAADKLLKGKSFEKTLLTSTPEGITLQPLYSMWDELGHRLQVSYPGQTPFLRGVNASGQTRGWHIAQTISKMSPVDANSAILDGLKSGENAVSVLLTSGIDSRIEGAIIIRDIKDFSGLLQDVDLAAVPLFIRCDASSSSVLAAALSAYLKQENLSSGDIFGRIISDPIADYARLGVLPRSMADLLKEQQQLQGYKANFFRNIKLLAVDVTPFHTAGASAVEELGIAMSIAVAYLRNILSKRPETDLTTLANEFCFSFACGSNFFMEIAKLRAARLLWTRILEEFGDGEAAQNMTIHCETSRWNKTLLDPHVNILRATTEAMSAVIGGSNSIDIAPFNALSENSSSFSRRVARNIHHILREESHFHRVVDPAGGSSYVEKLTAQLAERAWSCFRELEIEGGVLESLKTSALQKRIAATAENRLLRLRRVKDTLVGSNRYANPAENLNLDSEKSAASETHSASMTANRSNPMSSGLSVVNEEAFDTICRAISGGITVTGIAKSLGDSEIHEIATLNMQRGAEMFEQLRRDVQALRVNAANGLRSIAFVCLGKPRDYRLRVEFTENLFATAGLTGDRIIDPDESLSLYPLLPERKDAVIVLCSSDALYKEHAITYVAAMRESGIDARVLIAGRPGENEATLRTAGVDGFIYSGCDILQALQHIVVALEEKI